MATPAPKPSKPLRDKTHLEFIRGLPCCICRDPRTVPHHAKTKGSGGGDDETVPLCHKHHTGDEGVHGLGRETFEKRFGVDLLEIARYLVVYRERMRGLS